MGDVVEVAGVDRGESDKEGKIKVSETIMLKSSWTITDLAALQETAKVGHVVQPSARINYGCATSSPRHSAGIDTALIGRL